MARPVFLKKQALLYIYGKHMAYDFRAYLNLLEKRKDLVRVNWEVSSRFEIAALLKKHEKQNKSVLFENIKGAGMPLVGGLFHNMQRVADALNATLLPEFVRLEDISFLENAVTSALPAETVKDAPVNDIVKTGRDVCLYDLPVPTFFEHDSGPFITGGVGIACCPETGSVNAGIYTVQVIGQDEMCINLSPHSDLAAICRHAEKSGQILPVAIAIGVEPALLVASSTKVPYTVSELDVAGALKGEPLKVVCCETCDLPKPAGAEIVIEGLLDPSNRSQLRLGEFSGYYADSLAPIIKVNAVTCRHDAIFHSILAGPSAEHRTLGFFGLAKIKAGIIRALKEKFPEIKRISFDVVGTGGHLFITMAKSNDESPVKMIRGVFSTTVESIPVSQVVQRVLVFDDDVDVYDPADIEWAQWSRVEKADRFIILPQEQGKGQRDYRIGIDATKSLASRKKFERVRIP
jgi:2,5-furandicarboxylate decarboxylase 1